MGNNRTKLNKLINRKDKNKMSTKVERIQDQMNKTTDIKELETLEKELKLAILEDRADQNAKRLEGEKMAKERFEKERAEHLAKLAEIEKQEKFLATQETEMLNQFATAVGMVKVRSDTYKNYLKLVKETNRDSGKFGLDEIEPIELDYYQANSSGYTDLSNALTVRITDLLRRNENNEKRLPINPATIKLHPTKWGTP